MKPLSQTEHFSLVLSGGGALGIAHLGVLHDLEQLHMIPSELVGTSMGGIIAACISIGMQESQIYAHLQAFSSLTKWIKFSFSGNAIIEHKRLAAIFDELFGKRTMSDTEIPLKLIATNLKTGTKRVFQSGDQVSLRDAVLATMAIPGIFQECSIEGEVYGDGFLCENLGITEATYRQVIAVDVLGSHAFDTQLPEHFFKTANVLEMFERSMRLLIYNQTQTNLKHSDKEILLLEPNTRDFKTFHFHKTEEIRKRGLGLL